jgi:hypothetical protein
VAGCGCLSRVLAEQVGVYVRNYVIVLSRSLATSFDASCCIAFGARHRFDPSRDQNFRKGNWSLKRIGLAIEAYRCAQSVL